MNIADNLIKAFNDGYQQGKRDAVVRGEWVVTDAYPHRVYCSLCYKTNIYNAEILEGKEYPRFCMWCGAKMEGKP
jgi:hypothetical protein